MSLYDLLRSDGSIVINKKLAHAVGIDAAIMYSEIISKQTYFKNREELTEDGFFFNTVEDMQKDTALSKYQQSKAIKKLVELNLIFHQNRGLPQKRYFKVNPNENHIMKILDIGQKLKNSTIKSKGNEQIKVKELFSNNTKSNNNKNKTNKHLITNNEGHVFNYYSKRYKEETGKEHPLMTKEKLEELQSNYEHIRDVLDIWDDETWEELVDYHFKYLIPVNDGNILSFLALNGGCGCITRYLEEIYDYA